MLYLTRVHFYVKQGIPIKYILRLIQGHNTKSLYKIDQKLFLVVSKLSDKLPMLNYAKNQIIYQILTGSFQGWDPYCVNTQIYVLYKYQI